MAKTNDTPTLFQRLGQLRSTVRAARVEVKTLRDSMNLKSKPDADSAWEPAADLHIQLGNVLTALDEAFDMLKPLREHIDQPVLARSPKSLKARSNAVNAYISRALSS